MSMQFVYGRAGTGKSTFCLNRVKEYIEKNNLEEKFYIIVPEQFSYATEKALLEILKNESTVNAEVITFKRMANRVFTEVRRKSKSKFIKNW